MDVGVRELVLSLGLDCSDDVSLCCDSTDALAVRPVYSYVGEDVCGRLYKFSDFCCCWSVPIECEVSMLLDRKEIRELGGDEGHQER